MELATLGRAKLMAGQPDSVQRIVGIFERPYASDNGTMTTEGELNVSRRRRW
jgi:hypothetical protein